MLEQNHRTIRGLCALALLLGLAVCARGERGLPAQQGVGNFGKVSANLYRGARPDAAGVENLKRLGIKVIIDLQTTKETQALEEVAARKNGILYTNIPLRGLGRPNEDAVRTILAIIDSAPGPVFIHCKHGCDRTGTIVACYRIGQHRWSSEVALQEARKYGLSRFERGMKRFVAEFGRALLAKAPELPLKAGAERGPSAVSAQARAGL